MIIGISGKIGSGKDTIGKIIQLLTVPKECEHKKYEIVEAVINNFSIPNYVTYDIMIKY
jgi:ABC-type polysaccharide/polyol phosphate transport system ATPase subunit